MPCNLDEGTPTCDVARFALEFVTRDGDLGERFYDELERRVQARLGKRDNTRLMARSALQCGANMLRDGWDIDE